MNTNLHIDNFAVLIVVGCCAIFAAAMVYRAWKQAGKRGCGGSSCACSMRTQGKLAKKM